MIDLEGLEKLAARLRQIVKSYEAKNQLRTADFHGEDCSCYRCAVDACDAAVNALPELLAMAKENARLREALAILDAADEFEGEPDDKKLFVAMRVADLRRARAALKETDP